MAKRRKRNRRAIGSLVAVLVLLAPTSSAGPLAPQPGFDSGNVEYVRTVPHEAGGAMGARIVDGYLYVAGAKSFTIYDISTPEDPQLVSITPTGFYFANEDVDTNGSILLIARDQGPLSGLAVYDVEDKSSPALIGELQEGVRDHNYACVLDCTYAYGSRGSIIDLKDPTAPERVGIWGVGSNPADGFDTTEVAPGLVLAATRPLQLIDGRKDPTRPTVVARGMAPDDRLLHSVEWPRGGRDRWALVQGETFAEARCDSDSGALMTFDTRRWKRTRTLRYVDSYRTSNGTFTDGAPPANVLGCTAMWFDPHPTFKDGGLVAAAWFEHGTRFLKVSRKGAISEVGYFLPVGGSPISALWANEEIVYVVDVERGLDVLRFTGRV